MLTGIEYRFDSSAAVPLGYEERIGRDIEGANSLPWRYREMQRRFAEGASRSMNQYQAERGGN